MDLIKKITFTLLYFFTLSFGYAQDYRYDIFSREHNTDSLLITINQTSNDKIDQLRDSIIDNFHNTGYINAYIKSKSFKDSVFTDTIHLGKQIETLKLYIDNEIVSKSISKKYATEYGINYIYIPLNETQNYINEVLKELENSGNAFATAKISSLKFNNEKNELEGQLMIDLNKKRTIDKIVLNEYNKFPQSFTKHFLNLKIGKEYNREKLEYSSNAVKALPFAEEIRKPEVLFTNDSTHIYLYLKKKQANSFDGLLGFFTDEEGGLKFNGHLDLKLNNILNKGEQLAIRWQNNGEERTEFNINVVTPYLFNSPLTLDAYLNLYKQDSTFINIKRNIGATFTITPNNSFRLNYQAEDSNDLSSSSTSTTTEFKNKFYGIKYTYNKFDQFRPFIRKFYASIHGLWGDRTLVEQKTTESQSQYQLEFEYNLALNYNNAIRLRNTSGVLFSDDFLVNELFRIGGTQSIRGFNEESIFTSTYSVTNLEYHYFLDYVSNIYTISDFAITNDANTNDTINLYGFGLGYVYQTKNGAIDISYAIGKTEDIPFDFRNSRVHIKLIQNF